jgi:hypothetical protein
VDIGNLKRELFTSKVLVIALLFVSLATAPELRPVFSAIMPLLPKFFEMIISIDLQLVIVLIKDLINEE